jgi:hypothetical protein
LKRFKTLQNAEFLSPNPARLAAKWAQIPILGADKRFLLVNVDLLVTGDLDRR